MGQLQLALQSTTSKALAQLWQMKCKSCCLHSKGDILLQVGPHCPLSSRLLQLLTLLSSGVPHRVRSQPPKLTSTSCSLISSVSLILLNLCMKPLAVCQAGPTETKRTAVRSIRERDSGLTERNMQESCPFPPWLQVSCNTTHLGDLLPRKPSSLEVPAPRLSLPKMLALHLTSFLISLSYLGLWVWRVLSGM